MLKSWLVIGAFSICLVSCSEDAKEGDSKNEAEKPTTVEKSNTPADAQPITFNPPTTTAPITTAGVNPAHGQPGHTCDLPVGAPLDGSGAQNPVATTTPDQTVTQPTAQGTPSANGLNPAHGQPGHDCAVPVGDPLPAK